MSRHRENVMWQAPDGTWSMGFYTVIGPPFDEQDDDYDDEWDVDYDRDTFEYVTTGHPTPETADTVAVRDRDIPNPGGGRTYRLDHDATTCAELDAMAAAYFAAATP